MDTQLCAMFGASIGSVGLPMNVVTDIMLMDWVEPEPLRVPWRMDTMTMTSFCRKSLGATSVLCICLLSLTYTFNSCLVANISKALRRGHMSYALSTGHHTHHSSFDSEVRVVPLTGPLNEIDGAPKYRFLRQQGLRPSRHLPDALIIGVKKAGTRALLEFIRLHPDVRAAGSEVHFFDRYYNKGFHWYRERMPLTLEGQLTMEKTPGYWVTIEAPRRVQHMNPSTRLLVVVRDPVTRAVSDYAQSASKKPGMRKFEELAFLNGSRSLVDTSWGPVKIGVYAKHLERWLKCFPLSQMLFVSGERLIVDPAAELARVQDFLGLKRVVNEKHFYFNSSKGFPCLLKSEGRPSPHCLGKTKGRTHPNVPSATLERLRDFYRPFNARFYQLTGIHFGWQ